MGLGENEIGSSGISSSGYCCNIPNVHPASERRIQYSIICTEKNAALSISDTKIQITKPYKIPFWCVVPLGAEFASLNFNAQHRFQEKVPKIKSAQSTPYSRPSLFFSYCEDVIEAQISDTVAPPKLVTY
jgi:hypothetical protein